MNEKTFTFNEPISFTTNEREVIQLLSWKEYCFRTWWMTKEDCKTLIWRVCNSITNGLASALYNYPFGQTIYTYVDEIWTKNAEKIRHNVEELYKDHEAWLKKTPNFNCGDVEFEANKKNCKVLDLPYFSDLDLWY